MAIMVAAPRATPTTPRAFTRVSAPVQRRSSPPRRFIPDDSLFTASHELMEDTSATNEARSLKARAMLPTPVAAKDCTRMWIPAARLTAEHNIDEILHSLNADNQPATWKEHRASIRDFVRIPHQGISFLCTSDAALHSLGGIQLTICDTAVTIRKYSKYDKLYYVDLTRLPGDVLDSDIYDWFVTRGSRPVLITPTYVAGELKSRDRTVYFNEVACPTGLFTDNGDPLREIFFVPDDKPCFVQHRLHKYNRVKPPSLRKPARDGDERMSMDEPTSAEDDASHGASPVPNSPSPSGTTDPSTTPPPASSTGSSPDSTTGSSAPSRAPAKRTDTPRLSKELSFIPRVVSTDTPDWQRVQSSRRGIIADAPAPTVPPNSIACELADDTDDPSALTYWVSTTPNMYEVLRWEALDTTMPPDVDMAMTDDADMTDDPEEYIGFTADSHLVDHAAAGKLMTARRVVQKETHMSPASLDQLIQEFVERDMQHFTSHDDTLAALQAQPAYFRRIFRMPAATQTKLLKTHVVYRVVCAANRKDNEPLDFTDRLQTVYPAAKGDPVKSFKLMFSDKEAQDKAIAIARADLFLMVFSPGIYFDPAKVHMLQQGQTPPKRLRNTPFLLWSDVNLILWSQQDVARDFIGEKRTPPPVRKALQALASSQLNPADTAKQSCLVRPL